MTSGSVFPTTHATWLRTQIAEDAARGAHDAAAARNPANTAGADAGQDRGHDGGHDNGHDTDLGAGALRAGPARGAAARRHVMERYAGPLAAFVRGSSLSRLGEADDIVHGFLASRLSDARFLEAWAASGLRLRRWLMNGLLFHGQGLARDRARAAARGASVDPRALDLRILDLRASDAADFATAETSFERAWALAVVREATARVESELSTEGRTVDFEIFRRHAVDGQPYAAFARDFGRSEQQCAGATRLVAQRVRASLAALLREEGVPESELEDEIARVRGVL